MNKRDMIGWKSVGGGEKRGKKESERGKGGMGEKGGEGGWNGGGGQGVSPFQTNTLVSTPLSRM